MHSNTNGSRGFTLVEVTVILLVLTILSTIMLPQLGNYNRLARFVKVKEDLGAICSVLKRFIDDVGEPPYGEGWYDNYNPGPRKWPIGLLIGNGDTPVDGGYGTQNWTRPNMDEFGVTTDGGGMRPEFIVDTFDNHLIANTPMGSGQWRWRTPVDMERGFHSLFAWRGPYLDEISSDPWGNRYMANVFALHSPPEAGPHDRYGSAVVCLSAGPDAEVDTDFNQPFGWTTNDDDLTAVLSSGGPM